MSNLPRSPAGGDATHRVGAIVVAAGLSRRMDGVDKLFLPLAGTPLLGHTLAAIHTVSSIRHVVLVLNRSNFQMGRALVAERGLGKVVRVCQGGASRRESVRLGLQVLPPCDWVVVHDGARPCVEPELIERGLQEARRWSSAVAAVPLRDTLKVADAKGEVVTATLDRQGVWAVQTPQVFSWQTLSEAHRQGGEDATDDAALVERLGLKVHLYPGSSANIKVTTLDDSRVAEAVLRHRGEGRE